MDRRKKIIIISILVLVIVLLIALIFFFLNRKPVTIDSTPTNQTEVLPLTNGTIDVLPEPSEERIKNDSNYPLGLESFTSSYAERFASYSSDANFKNLKDLEVVSTSRMQIYINNLIVTSQIGQNGYEAQVAKALNNKIISVSSDQAVVLISLQLSKYFGEQSNATTDYSKIELSVIKVNGEWIVDSISWQ